MNGNLDNFGFDITEVQNGFIVKTKKLLDQDWNCFVATDLSHVLSMVTSILKEYFGEQKD